MNLSLKQHTFLAGVMAALAIPAALAATPAATLQTWPQHQAADMNPTRTIQVVNIWATWCTPCRQEMPMLSHWAQQKQRQEGRRAPEVIGIAIDNDANLQRFSRQVKVSYPLLRYTGQDSQAWMQSLGNSVGGLPLHWCVRRVVADSVRPCWAHLIRTN